MPSRSRRARPSIRRRPVPVIVRKKLEDDLIDSSSSEEEEEEGDEEFTLTAVAAKKEAAAAFTPVVRKKKKKQPSKRKAQRLVRDNKDADALRDERKRMAVKKLRATAAPVSMQLTKAETQAAHELGTFYLRVVKPVREHNHDAQGSQRIFCVCCNRFISKDYCVCGKLLGEHGMGDDHYPEPLMQFDNIFHANVCAVHGRSFDAMKPMRTATQILYSKIVPRVCAAIDQGRAPLVRDALLGTDYMSLDLAPDLYKHLDRLIELDSIKSDEKFLKESDVCALVASLHSWKSMYDADFKNKKAAGDIDGHFDIGRSRLFLPVPFFATVLDLVSFILLDFSLLLRHGKACQQLVKKYYATTTTAFPFLSSKATAAEAAAEAAAADALLDRLRLQKSCVSAKELCQTTAGETGFLPYFFRVFMAHLYGSLVPMKDAAMPAGVTTKKGYRAFVKEQSAEMPLAFVDVNSPSQVIGDMCGRLYEKVKEALERCQLTTDEPRSLFFPDDFHKGTWTPLVPFGAHEVMLPVYDDSGRIIRVVGNSDLGNQRATETLLLGERVVKLCKGINSNLDRLKTNLRLLEVAREIEQDMPTVVLATATACRKKGKE